MRNTSEQRRGTTDMTQLHAQPYDISASGFYFDSLKDYQAKAVNARND
jgi:hypothetical protein